MVPETKYKVVYEGDGLTRSFPFPYRFFEGKDIQAYVFKKSVGREEKLTKNYHFDEVSKIFTYPREGSPLEVGDKIVLIRNTEKSQLKDYPDKYPFPYVEEGIDKITMIMQEVDGKVGKVVKLGETYTVDEVVLPPYLPGGVLQWDREQVALNCLSSEKIEEAIVKGTEVAAKVNEVTSALHQATAVVEKAKKASETVKQAGVMAEQAKVEIGQYKSDIQSYVSTVNALSQNILHQSTVANGIKEEIAERQKLIIQHATLANGLLQSTNEKLDVVQKGVETIQDLVENVKEEVTKAQGYAASASASKSTVETARSAIENIGGQINNVSRDISIKYGDILSKYSDISQFSTSATASKEEATRQANLSKQYANEAKAYAGGDFLTQAKADTIYAQKGSYATVEYVEGAIGNLVGTAPEALNTLQELATEIQNNKGSLANLLTQVGEKANRDEVYNKSYIDSTLRTFLREDTARNTYATISALNHKVDTSVMTSRLNEKANANAVYSKSESENLFYKKTDVVARAVTADNCVKKNGDTMTGNLTVPKVIVESIQFSNGAVLRIEV